MDDLQIAKQCNIKPIIEIAKKLSLTDEDVLPYGKYIAKIDLKKINILNKSKAKLILVTAIHPTPAGEGKTTVSVGLADALSLLGRNVCLALREPSLGPVFGMKGGATGGGMSQIMPMENINLHFTGDFHAITSANNLLAAMIDNHIHQGNELNIDPRTVVWQRCMDINDRQLRYIISGIGGKINGTPREDAFVITAASHIMAVFCLSQSLKELKENIANIVVAKSYSGESITAGMLKADGAMTALLKDAFNPNLVQSIEGTPCIMHGGPFANIAHGCNSIVATKLAMSISDIVVTEAGFGADLGAEKFLDIKCRKMNEWPDALVLVATIRSLKYQGKSKDIKTKDMKALKSGFENLYSHVTRLREIYKLPIIVAINKFYTDTEEEINFIKNKLSKMNIMCEISNAYSEGGKGAVNLANSLINLLNSESKKIEHHPYELEDSIKEKIKKLAIKFYGAIDVKYSDKAIKIIAELENSEYSRLPICVAKTQYSFSDDPSLINVNSGFVINVKNIELNSGAGFIIVHTGEIMKMPGLPKRPAAFSIDIDQDEEIVGLY